MSAKSFGPPEHDSVLTVVIVNTRRKDESSFIFLHDRPFS